MSLHRQVIISLFVARHLLRRQQSLLHGRNSRSNTLTWTESKLCLENQHSTLPLCLLKEVTTIALAAGSVSISNQLHTEQMSAFLSNESERPNEKREMRLDELGWTSLFGRSHGCLWHFHRRPTSQWVVWRRSPMVATLSLPPASSSQIPMTFWNNAAASGAFFQKFSGIENISIRATSDAPP